jgi:choline dehydrogenase-like flavoprotein
MSLKDNHKFSDILGRVNNLKNVHIIDSSVLPQIPISTITYTLMANAARIVDKTSKK